MFGRPTKIESTNISSGGNEMKTTIFVLLLGSLTGLALLGCDDDEKEAPERVLSLSIDAPSSVDPGLCNHSETVEITVSARDQHGRAWGNAFVSLSIEIDNGIFVDTSFAGHTSPSGDVIFLYGASFYGASERYQIRAWAEGDTVISEMRLESSNEGSLGVNVIIEPDTIPLSSLADTVMVRMWFMYDNGSPEGDSFLVRPEIGLLADSLFQVSYGYIYTDWYLPPSPLIGRYNITAYYSSVCRELSDSTSLWILP